jgi:serine/threonine protein kinase
MAQAYVPQWIAEGTDLVDIGEGQLPYTLIHNLGSGGCGVVEKVKDNNTGQFYARKVFFLRTSTARDKKKMFKNEIDVIRSMGYHPHLIRVVATYTTTHKLGIILSPVADGGDLDKYLGNSQIPDGSWPVKSTHRPD